MAELADPPTIPIMRSHGRRLLLVSVTACSAAATEALVRAALRRFGKDDLGQLEMNPSDSFLRRVSRAVVSETAASLEYEILSRRSRAAAVLDRALSENRRAVAAVPRQRQPRRSGAVTQPS